MSDNENNTLTHHAMLVAWGQFAQSIGLIDVVEAVPLHQKAVDTDRRPRSWSSSSPFWQA